MKRIIVRGIDPLEAEAIIKREMNGSVRSRWLPVGLEAEIPNMFWDRVLKALGPKAKVVVMKSR